jgi:hypothetical protein
LTSNFIKKNNLKLFFQFHDEEFTLNALNDVVWCMTRTTGCCAATTPPTLTKCSKTQGPFGELINDFATHPGIAASAKGVPGEIIPWPVDPAGVILQKILLHLPRSIRTKGGIVTTDINKIL